MAIKKKLSDYKIAGLLPKEDVEPDREAPFHVIMNYYGRKEYEKRFKETLKSRLYSELSIEDTNKTLECLEDNRVKIINAESFFDTLASTEDMDTFYYQQYRSVDVFFLDAMLTIKRRILTGQSQIILNSFLFHVAVLMAEAEKKGEPVEAFATHLYTFMVSLTDITGIGNPVKIRVFDYTLAKGVMKRMGVDPKKYEIAASLAIHAAAMIGLSMHYRSLSAPAIQFVRGFKNKGIDDAYRIIADSFKISAVKLKAQIKRKDFMCEDSELRVMLGELASSNNVPASVVQETFDKVRNAISDKGNYLKDVDNLPKLKSPKNKQGSVIPVMKGIWIDSDLFEGSPFEVFGSVEIDCLGFQSFDIVEFYLDCSARILRVRSKMFNKSRAYKITLKRVEMIDPEFIKKLKTKAEDLSAEYGIRVFFEVQYYCRYGKGASKEDMNVKSFRVISDIHCDINKNKEYEINFGRDFVVSCGDASGRFEWSRDWIDSHIHQGILVHGNHLGYSSEDPINMEIEKLARQYPLDGKIKYLNNSSVEIDGVVFIGCCLYTDFKLYGEENQERCMDIAQASMNDFRYPKYIDKNGVTRRLTPSDYIEFFNESKNFLYRETLKYSNKPVVIVTHFAPHIKSISKKYGDSFLNAAYASDMSDLLDKRTNIKVWCHGHVHEPVKYTYNNTQIISMPFGYYNENNFELPYNYGAIINYKTLKLKGTKRTKSDAQ